MSVFKKGKFKSHGQLLTDVLGSNLYTKLESVIAEYVTNAWDSNASKVEILYPDKDIQDDPDEVVVISDNGNDFDWDRLFGIATDRVCDEIEGRDVIGKKGIGRFAGFKLANKIIYKQVRGGRKYELEYDLKTIKEGALEDLQLEVVESQCVDEDVGKQVVLSSLRQGEVMPTKDSLINFLLEEFGLNQDFKIYINGDEVTEDDLEKGEVKKLDFQSESFGAVNGRIVARTSPSGMKRQPGVIVRIKNRRVDGPGFFGQESTMQKNVQKRIYGEVNVDELEDLIHSGREYLLRADKRYQDFTSWLSDEIGLVADKILESSKTDVYEKMMSLSKVTDGFGGLDDYQQREAKKILKYISPKLGRVKNDKPLLETIGLLIIRAVESNDFANVLKKLEQTPNEDISALAKLLNHWGIKEIVNTAQTVRSRLTMLAKFAFIIGDPASRELQDVHAILDKNPWIFDERFSVFSSNRQMRTIAKKLRGEDTDSTDRPDLILRTNGKDFLLVELKRPGVSIDLDEVNQVLRYKKQLADLHPNMRDLDSYLIGTDYDDVALSNYPAGNTQKVHLISLSELLNEAQQRLKWIHSSLTEEYEDVLGDDPDYIDAESVQVLESIGFPLKDAIGTVN